MRVFGATWIMDKSIMLQMLMLTLLLLGRAVGLSDEPPRPSISVSFYAKGEVERHLPEETRFGECKFQLGFESVE